MLRQIKFVGIVVKKICSYVSKKKKVYFEIKSFVPINSSTVCPLQLRVASTDGEMNKSFGITDSNAKDATVPETTGSGKMNNCLSALS